MTKATPQLLCCPFCGGEARPMYALDEGTKQITYTVMCMSCSTAIFHPRMSVFEWDAYDTEEEAAAAWNTRHEETCQITNKWEPEYDVITRDYEFSCGHTIAWGHTYEPNYCPNCGRKVVDE